MDLPVKEKHMFEDVVIWTRLTTNLDMFTKDCPVCRKKIEGGKMYIIINNYILFPNICIHEDCLSSWDEIFTFLKKDYKDGLEMRSYYKCWFD